MPYLGSAPATSSQSLVKQDFSVSATTNYTLSQSVTSANDIALYINNVRQEPTTAYSASGTSLTLTSATASTDDMYCVYIGRAVGTINPASGSVGLAQLSATGTKSSSTFFRGDNSFASISTTPNAPAFMALRHGNIAVTNNTRNKVQCDTEIFDSGGQYDNSTNYRFTPTTAGKYYVFGNAFLIAGGNSTVQWILNEIWKNGTSGTRISGSTDFRANNGNSGSNYVGAILDMNGSSDYVELYSYPGVSSGTPVLSGTNTSIDTFFGAYKLGV
tara:strand:+ start:973 stop:1791 length:819 start_codon:yes stop_codon:yes gene_type:complete